MSRTLEALRRIEARGLPLTVPGAPERQWPDFESGEAQANASLERAEAAVALAVDDYAWGAHRPIPPMHWSEVDAAAAIEVESPIDFEPQPDFVPEPAMAIPAAEPIVLGRGAGNLEAYRALRSRLMTRQSAAGGSVLLLAATSKSVGRGFSAAALALALSELDLGEVLIVDQVGPVRSMTASRGMDDYLHWQQQMRATTEPQVRVLPVSANFLTSAALHDVCLWDRLRERFRFVLLGPWLASEPALSRLAESHDGALLLLGWNESQRAALHALRQLTAGGSRVLGCVVAA